MHLMPETTVSWTSLELSENKLRIPKMESRSLLSRVPAKEETCSELTTGCQEFRAVTFHDEPRYRLHS